MDALLRDHLVTLVVFTPAAAAALLLFFPRSAQAAARNVALAAAILDFAVSLPLWTRFALTQEGFQFREKVAWVPQLGIFYNVGIDGISLLLVLLTTLLTPVALLFSLTHVEKEV